MKKKTVKRRIFLSNTWMILVTLLIFLAINVIFVRVYAEAIEHEFRASMEKFVDDAALEELFENYTIHRNEFFVLILCDGILCVTVLILVSRFFTKRLVSHIMRPLNVLAEGASNIRSNNLTENIEYHGDMEFEDVCDSFNDMRKSILAEQERNIKYEKARTDMIAGISHDLKTPLTAVRGTIKGILDGVVSTPEQENKFLNIAYRRTGDMDVLLNQLFYLSKLQTGNMPIDIKTIDISNFVLNYIKEKRNIFTNNEFEIAAETNGVTCNAAVDPEQLYRIFDNLLENSRKYAETIPLEINIVLNKIGGKVEVRFSDNGIGVEKEKLPYIFEEFYRGDESRNKKDGNGLGLYIVKYLMEAMGGSVKAESNDGFSVIMFLNET